MTDSVEKDALLCAVIACQRPQGQPHIDGCPYYGQDNIVTVPPATARAIKALRDRVIPPASTQGE